MLSNYNIHKLSTLFILLFSSYFLQAQNVIFKDSIFKSELVKNTNINTNLDNEIQATEAKSYSGAIALTSIGIKDITGIDAFINISVLSLVRNSISIVDLSKNNKLRTITLFSNNINSFKCNSKELINIDLSNNSQLDSLQLNNCPNLQKLTLKNSYTNYLNLDSCLNLNTILIENANFTTLDLSHFFNLYNVTIRNTNLEYIDLSWSKDLSIVDLRNNKLSACDIANGNNTFISSISLSGNPNACIQVDDTSYSRTNWSYIDASSKYRELCCENLNKKIIIKEDSLFAKRLKVNYQWVNCNNGNAPIANQTNSFFIPDTNGNFACIMTSTNCLEVTNCYQYTKQLTNNKKILPKKPLGIYPNPTNDLIHIDPIHQGSKYYIYTISGEVIKEGFIGHTITLDNFNPGFYILSILQNSNIIMGKFKKN